MNIDIRSNVINNIKEEKKDSLKEIINESVNKEDEISLPGMGVLLELCWNNCSDELKNDICISIEKGLKN